MKSRWRPSPLSSSASQRRTCQGTSFIDPCEKVIASHVSGLDDVDGTCVDEAVVGLARNADRDIDRVVADRHVGGGAVDQRQARLGAIARVARVVVDAARSGTTRTGASAGREQQRKSMPSELLVLLPATDRESQRLLESSRFGHSGGAQSRRPA